jgi:hypothetical protein
LLEEEKLLMEALEIVRQKLRVLDAQEPVTKSAATFRPALQDKPSKEGR